MYSIGFISSGVGELLPNGSHQLRNAGCRLLFSVLPLKEITFVV